MKKIISEDIHWNVKKFPLVVIAENMHSPSNIGMMIRLCEAFGASELHFTGPFTNQTKKYKKSARSAEQYLHVFKSEDTISVIQSLKARHYHIIGIEICENGKSLHTYEIPKGNICLLIGSERHGINEMTMNFIDDCIHIEQFGSLGSINAAMALSISLFETTKQLNRDIRELDY